MPEVPISPQVPSTLPALASRSDEARTNPERKIDEQPAATPFADVLKSKDKEARPDPGKDDTQRADASGWPDPAATSPTPTTQVDLLSRLVAEGPSVAQKVMAEAKMISPTIEVPVTASPDPANATGIFTPPVMVAIAPASGTILSPTAGAAQPMVAAVTVLPTTTTGNSADMSPHSLRPDQSGLYAARAESDGESGSRKNPLAGQAAIPAEGGGPRAAKAAADFGAVEFAPLLEHVSESPPTVLIQAAATQGATTTVQLKLETAFAQPGWGKEIDQKLTWMTSNAKHQADLVLNPPHLGRIEVTLVLDGDKLSASFTSPHQAVREALEDSLVRLRDALGETGVTLGETHVGAESRRDSNQLDSRNDGRSGQPDGSGTRPKTIASMGPGSAWHSGRGRGMVDLYA